MDALLNSRLKELQLQMQGLERTQEQLLGTQGGAIGGWHGERKYLTKKELLEIKSKIESFRADVVARDKEIARKTKVINDLKARFSSELLEIKKEILVDSAKAAPSDFRKLVETHLLTIRKEVENIEQDQAQQKFSEPMVPLSTVVKTLEEMKKIRNDYIAQQNKYSNFFSNHKKKVLKIRESVVQLVEENAQLRAENEQLRKGERIPRKLQADLHGKLKVLRDHVFRVETENKSLKLDQRKLSNESFSPEYEISSDLLVRCTDMHTGGEPLRIIDTMSDGGIPLDLQTNNLKDNSLLQRREFMKSNLDHLRKFLMLEPRGHSDMYGAIIVRPDADSGADFGVLFMHNEGYSTMCGHAVIALGRYAVDSGLVKEQSALGSSGSSEEKAGMNGSSGQSIGGYKRSRIVKIQTPCGVVEADVELGEDGKSSGKVSFISAPGWAEQVDQSVEVEKVGKVSYDIGFGGAFYAILPAKALGLSVTRSSVKELVNAGTMITEKVRNNLKAKALVHPEGKKMEFLYGTIFTEDSSDKNGPSNNITIFADKQVDRCPTGSGVIARLAVDNVKKLVELNEKRDYVGPTGSVFNGMIKEKGFGFGKKSNCVRVQVSGSAFYMATSKLYLEKSDALGKGFLLR